MWLETLGDRRRELLFNQATAAIANEVTLIGLPFDGSDIYQCAFSSDGRRVFFSAKRYGTTNALMAVEVASKVIANLGGTNGFEVIYDCADRALVGKIISNVEDYGGPFHGFHLSWFALLEASRYSYRIVGPIGPDEENVTRFLAKRCGMGSAPPPAAKPVIPVARLRAACPQYEFRAESHDLLDGSTVDVFHFAARGTESFVDDLRQEWSAPDFVAQLSDLECARGVL